MKIVFSGSGGSGKSTLVHKMIEIWPEQFGHLTLIDSVRHPDHSTMTQRQRQDFLNKEYRSLHMKDDFISSRSLFDVYAYSRTTVGLWHQWVQWQSTLKKIEYDWLFYLPIEFEVEPNEDGTRPVSQAQIENFNLELQIVLNFYHVPVSILTGSVSERLDTIATLMRLETNGDLREKY